MTREPAAGAATHRVFASVVLPLCAFAQAYGIDRARFFRIAGLDEVSLDDPDGTVPYEAIVAVWRELVTSFPKEPLGLRYATLLSVGELSVVGYALRHARDGHQALELSLRFTRLLDPFLNVTAERRGDSHVVRIEHEPRVVAMVEPLEMLVVAMVRMAVSLVGDGAAPSEVTFRHTARHPIALYEEVLGPGVTMRFGGAFDGVVFSSALLDLPLRAADPRMAAYLAKHAEVLLEQVVDVQAPFDERVRHAVRAALPAGAVAADEIAKQLGVSLRTLQRDLHERGTSLSREVDEARKERALALLRRPELTVAEVAFMVGYAESRVFLRSFRRWTGQTPTEFRRAK